MKKIIRVIFTDKKIDDISLRIISTDKKIDDTPLMVQIKYYHFVVDQPVNVGDIICSNGSYMQVLKIMDYSVTCKYPYIKFDNPSIKYLFARNNKNALTLIYIDVTININRGDSIIIDNDEYLIYDIINDYNSVPETLRESHQLILANYKYKIKQNNKKETKMSNLVKKFQEQFIPIKVHDFKMTLDGKLCVKTSEDEYTAITENNELITYPESITLDIPVYQINKSSDQIKEGDIVKHNSYSYSKVVGRTKEGKLKLLSFTGNTVYKAEIKDFITNKSFVPVIINIVDSTNLNTLNGINPMMLLALSDDKSDNSLKNIMLMQMMGQSSINPMMLFLLNKDNNNSSLIETMLLMGQGNIFNPTNSNK